MEQRFEQEKVDMKQQHKQEIAEKEQKYKQLANKKEQQRQVADQKVVSTAVKQIIKDYDVVIAEWEEKYKEIEKNNRKYYKDLMLSDRERRYTFKMHLQEVSRVVVRIRYITAMQDIFSEHKTGEAYKLLEKIMETTCWSNTRELLVPRYGSTFDKLKAEFPELNDEEYSFCCLYVIGEFSTPDIITLLGITEEQLKNIKNDTAQKLDKVGKNLGYLRNYDKYSPEA